MARCPALGDFFRIRLPRRFCDPWDKWLQGVLMQGREALGARWTDSYMSAPIWRFSASAGAICAAPVAGVVMPSVDQVGRAFPLTLAGLGAGTSVQIFEDLEDIALSALDDDMTRERLAAALDGVRAPPDGTPEPTGVSWRAVWGAGMLDFTSPVLPQGRDALRLFDMTLWPGADNLAEVPL